MNYINVLQIIEDFANQHPGVKRFKSDTLDRIEDFTNHDEDFPLLYAVLNNVMKIKTLAEYNADVYSFNVYCLTARIDINLERDNKLVLNQTNRNLSLTYSILCDLIDYLDNQDDNDVYIDYSLISNPVNNITKDRLQGVYITIQIQVTGDNCIFNDNIS